MGLVVLMDWCVRVCVCVLVVVCVLCVCCVGVGGAGRGRPAAAAGRGAEEGRGGQRRAEEGGVEIKKEGRRSEGDEDDGTV
jgi:hypothetical protein